MIRALGRLAVLAVGGVMLACAPPPRAPLTHEAYVWQRVWTPSLRAAMSEARASFSAYRLLALHTDRHGALQPIAVDRDAVAAAHLPVVAVARLDGSDAEVSAQTLTPMLLDVVAQWRAAGIAVDGVEIDHDCAVSKLPRYAQFLEALRGALPGDLRLSITALPAWTASADAAAVFAQADEAVLQVHAVSTPAQGLFDADRAAGWVREFAATQRTPFRVAVPDYGSRVSFDNNDAALSVESEMPLTAPGVRVEEMRAAPADVARLLATLEASRPDHLRGVVWFRLPVPEDRRSWSLRTLQAVIARRSLVPELDVVQRRGEGGSTDLWLVNRGEIDAPAPRQILLTAGGCTAADGAAGYTAMSGEGRWKFLSEGKEILRAGRERPIGWVHCAQVDKVEWNADP